MTDSAKGRRQKNSSRTSNFKALIYGLISGAKQANLRRKLLRDSDTDVEIQRSEWAWRIRYQGHGQFNSFLFFRLSSIV